MIGMYRLKLWIQLPLNQRVGWTMKKKRFQVRLVTIHFELQLTLKSSDSTAEKPADWDEEIDGSWEAPLLKNPLCEDNGCGKWEPPLIANPEYRGKWRAPLLDNPNYQGRWAPRRINNPDYFEDNNPFSRLTPIVSYLTSC